MRRLLCRYSSLAHWGHVLQFLVLANFPEYQICLKSGHDRFRNPQTSSHSSLYNLEQLPKCRLMIQEVIFTSDSSSRESELCRIDRKISFQSNLMKLVERVKGKGMKNLSRKRTPRALPQSLSIITRGGASAWEFFSSHKGNTRPLPVPNNLPAPRD
jgi:hypothetical protein